MSPRLLTPGEVSRLAPGDTPGPLPTSLPLASLHLAPSLFQWRRDGALLADHVSDLLRVVSGSDPSPLDPIKIWDSTTGFVVLNGHHRAEAYRRAGWADPVPVEVFQGPLWDARAVALGEGSKAVRPYDKGERMDAAWRAVADPECPWSKSETVHYADVSNGSVAKMRRVRDALKEQGEDPQAFPSWFLARSAAAGRERGDFGDRERAALVDRFVEGLAKGLGNREKRHPDLFAEALARYMGRRGPEVVEELVDALDLWDRLEAAQQQRRADLDPTSIDLDSPF